MKRAFLPATPRSPRRARSWCGGRGGREGPLEGEVRSGLLSLTSGKECGNTFLVDKERLKYVLREAEELPLPSIRPRAVQLPMNSGKVVVLVGIRRSGKTFLLLDLIRRLRAAGVDRSQIIQLSFEDDRLHPLRAADLDL